MSARRDGSTAAVSRLLPRLSAPAVLLTDDPGAAVRLLGAALAAPGALDSAEAALRALATAAVHRPRWAAHQVVETLPPTPSDDRDRALAAALRELPDRARAAVVLRSVGGLSPAALTEALGGDPAAESDAAAARLQDAVAVQQESDRQARAAFRAPGSPARPHEPVVPLPDRLARLAADRPLPSSAEATIVAALSLARRHRRRRWARAALAGVLVAGLSALVPVLPRGAPAEPSTSVYGAAPRGASAADADLVRGLTELSWPGATGPQPRRVVFVGDVAGRRWALVAGGGDASRPATIAWFTGPAGAAPDRLRVVTVRTSPVPDQPVWLTDPASGALVVVGAADDAVRASERPEVGADGRITRRSAAVATSRGVAVAALGPVPGAVGSAVRVEVRRAGARVDVAPPVVVTGTAAAPPPAEPGRLRPAPPASPGDAAVGFRLRTVLGQLGQPAGSARATVLWSGDLPGPHDQPARLSVLALEQPSGAVVVTVPFGYAADTTGRTGSSWCATGVLPAGAPLAQRVVAVSCDISDATVNPETSRFLVVVAPRAATSVQLFDSRDALLSEHPLRDGVVVVRSPGDVARLTVRGPDGVGTDATPLREAALDG